MKRLLPWAAAALALVLAAAGVLEAVRLYRARLAFERAAELYESSGRNPGPEAQAWLEASVRLAPGDPDPHYLLGRIASRQGRPEEALAHLDRALAANPFDGRVHYYRGRACWELKRVEDAVRSMETAADLSRNNPAHLFEIGYFYWFLWESENRASVTDFTRAFEYLTRAFEHIRAAAAFDLSYLDRALDLSIRWSIPYGNLVIVVPDAPEAHWRAGKFFGHRRGDWKAALAEFEAVGNAFEDSSAFLLDRGIARLVTGGDALADFRQSILLAGDRNAAIRRLPFYFSVARRSDEALSFWLELEGRFPELPAPVVNRAETELNMAKHALSPRMVELEKERNRVLKESTPAERGEREEYFAGKARALWREGLAGVENTIRDGLSAFPQEAQLHRLLADILELQGHVDESEIAFRRAAELGDVPDYWSQYISHLLRRQHYEAAWKAAMAARGRYPDRDGFQRLVEKARDLMLGQGPDKGK